MKIAYNPKDAVVVTATTAANNDILFDLKARKVWAKGLRMGADWEDISNKPSSLKNPKAIKFRNINGAEVSYDGSAAKDLMAGTYIAKLPYGFSSFTSEPTWGNAIGSSIASWNDKSGGSIDFRKDNPSSGKMSIKVNGRVYVNGGFNPVLSAEFNNSYWSIRTPDGGNNWIRTPKAGLLPYTYGKANSGHSSLGTNELYFSTAYIDWVYGNLRGNADTATNADTVDGEHASSFVRAGTYEHGNLNKLDTYSFIRSVNSQVSSTSPKGDIGWYNVILLVHRNGDDDGPSYIGQIALGMTTNTDDMFFRGKRTDSWKTVIHSGNISSQTVASATKLQTPRTIWGQSFDGTGNVNGTIYINNSNSSNGAIRLNNNVNSNARISAIDDQVIFNTSNAIRFGETAWDLNQWAGLKYTHSNKTIYLGIADGSVFNANSAQSNGTLRLAGITNITPDSEARIGGSGGDLYLGNADNSNWVKVQDMCSQVDSDNWIIYQSGSAEFKDLTIYGDTTIDGNLSVNGLISNIGGNENNNYSPDRVWGSNGSDSYLRSYRTSALNVNYASSARNADTLDGTHLNGIFTAFGNNAHNITATIGGVTKSFLVNWAADSDKLDGYHASSNNNKPWGTIPAITTSGYMDIGKDLEFHYDNTTGLDYSTALMCQGNYNNIVFLPSKSGTLALTSDIKDTNTWRPITDDYELGESGTSLSSLGSLTLYNDLLGSIPNPTDYYWANIKVSSSSSTTTSPTVNVLTATRVCAGHNPEVDNSISCSNWFRSSGNTGWYNTTYLGGWYMSDSTWIKSWGSKALYVNNSIRCTNLLVMYENTVVSAAKLENSNTLVYGTDASSNSINTYLRGTNVTLLVKKGTSINYNALLLTSDRINCNNYCNMKLGAEVSGGNFTVQNNAYLALNTGAKVGIGTVSPSYKLDVNGEMRANGFHHSSVNSDKYMLLAGGGYKSFGGDHNHPIFLGCFDLYHGNDGTISSSFECLGYSVPFTYTRGGNYCRISIPNTTHQVFYIKAAVASVNYSGGGMDTWTGNHRGAGAWWLHCYASGLNEVRVKGFCLRNSDNDSWWGGNPLWSDRSGVNIITVCIFGYVIFK